ncbi:hypothetical protein [Streptomyces sp. SID11385]|uniref:hypothetical protein n=1 Tax=Streptomyces sp. SID11385 TaxID=2706031 RepID=UPI0013C81A65|nr:hypothetical protein [Streptomyces sp. SID11385]NEA39886.1 hypothetical protein [Streptomyces sp. SID11385]
MHLRTPLTSAALAAALLGLSVSPSSASPHSAKGPGTFVTNGDRVHISSTPPRTASAHAWWTHVAGPGTKAKVTIWLQVKATKKGSKWHSVAKNSKNLKSGNGGSARRVVARKKCANRNTRQWRTLIDVDLIGVADTPEKVSTKTVTVRCGV